MNYNTKAIHTLQLPSLQELAILQSSLEKILRNWWLSPLKLNYFKRVNNILLNKHVARFTRKLGVDLPPSINNTWIKEKQGAKWLASTFTAWEDILSKSPKGRVKNKILRKGKPYQRWLEEGGHSSKYWPVHELKKIIDKRNGSVFFKKAIIHGSVATLDDTDGFSDLDLAFVVRIDVLRDSEKLLRLRNITTEILALTYAFDPFMHHAPYYISEIDFVWYPEAMFPLILFGHGVDLLDNSQETEIMTRPSDDITCDMFKAFEKFFRRFLNQTSFPKNSYDLEWVLGSAMLLPALYLQQRNGEFRYKRDTFRIAEKYFSQEEWEPIKIATELRKKLTSRPKPSHSIVWIARRLKWPGLIQWLARKHPAGKRRAQEAINKMGSDYPAKVLTLLASMQKRCISYRNKRTV